MTDRTLDREVNHDIRSFNYVMGGAELLPIRDVKWGAGLPILDQGSEGSCVGHAAARVAASMPGLSHTNRLRLCRHAMALSVYVLATNWDDIKGEYPRTDSGSTVNGALRALRNLGFVSLYQWLPSARAVAGAVSNIGPVDAGTVWGDSMMSTQPVDGHARIVVDGDPVSFAAGHSYAIIGVSAARSTLIVANSWGTGWGADGEAEISFDDFDRLLAVEGDAVVVSVNKSFDADAGLV